MPDENAVELKTSLFGIALRGPTAWFIFLLIAILALSGLTVWEHFRRETEHQQLACSIKLAIFIYSNPRDKPIQWDLMPVDLYPCVPKFLYDRGNRAQ